MSWRYEGQQRKEKSRAADDAVEVAEALGYTPAPQRLGRKKNGKRWCRGKVGREHQYELSRTVRLFNRTTSVFRCSECGRQEWRGLVT